MLIADCTSPATHLSHLPSPVLSPTTHQVSAFGVEKSDILRISAKTGLGVPALLDALVTRVPPPGGSAEGLFRALLLDSDYDSYRGAVNVVQVVDGSVSLGERIESVATGEVVEARHSAHFRAASLFTK